MLRHLGEPDVADARRGGGPRRHRRGRDDDLRPRRDRRDRGPSPTRSSSARPSADRCPSRPRMTSDPRPPAQARRHGRSTGSATTQPSRSLVARAGSPGHRSSRSARRTSFFSGILWTPLFGTPLRGRRLPVAALLAADRARLAADLVHQPGAPHPVDPARLPGHLLLLPQGLLPLLLRRPARLRRRRADGPPPLQRWRRAFPFILQNLHRYFLYLAFIPLFFLWLDAFLSLFADERRWRIGLGERDPVRQRRRC